MGKKAKRSEELCSGLVVTWNNFVPTSFADSVRWVRKISYCSMTQLFSANKLTGKIVVYFYKRLRD